MNLRAIVCLFAITLHSLSYSNILSYPEEFEKTLNEKYNAIRAESEKEGLISESLLADIKNTEDSCKKDKIEELLLEIEIYAKDFLLAKAIELANDEDLALLFAVKLITAADMGINSQHEIYKDYTPLMFAVIKNYPRVVKLLLNARASIELKNNNGHNVVELSDKIKTMQYPKSIEINKLLHDYQSLSHNIIKAIEDRDYSEMRRMLFEAMAKDYVHLAKVLIYEIKYKRLSAL